jgi:hypothetical protein
VTTSLIPNPILCLDPQRRSDILVHPTLNGIEFVEYERRPGPPEEHVLVVHFIRGLQGVTNTGPDGAYGLTTPPYAVHVDGGARIVGIQVTSVQLVGDNLEIFLSAEGDYSIYALRLGWTLEPNGEWKPVIPNLDPRSTVVPVNFKAGCPVDVDCRDSRVCQPERITEPSIDYLAKDYASFRRLLIDLLPQLNPGWLERTPADLGIALLEVLAYEGDQLSYFQDAASNEMFLDTARQRVSVKRHARLVDYAMHDGRNAWTFVHVRTMNAGTIPLGTQVLTRITAPMANQAAIPGVEIPAVQAPGIDALETDAALARTRVFETAFQLDTHPENNEIHLHTWGDVQCCLPKGTTTAHLFSLTPDAASQQHAILPALNKGDFLLFEEVKGPLTGAKPDADPRHRRVVEIIDVRADSDPAYSDRLVNGRLQVWTGGDTALPLARVTWRAADGKAFPMCLSSQAPGLTPFFDVTVARGNMVAVDHGLTIHEEIQNLPVPIDTSHKPFLLRLGHGPISMQFIPKDGYDRTINHPVTLARRSLTCEARNAQPAVRLMIDFQAETAQSWIAVPNLLDSLPFSPEFVADVDNDGRAVLRFGDHEYGKDVDGALKISAIYRVGNGRAGNVGAESIFHIVSPTNLGIWPIIDGIRNPIAAHDGTDPETIEDVRQYAPAAFRAEQFRAVNEQDYIDALRKMEGVAGAVASFRWTGSWYTVYVGVDPQNPSDLVTREGGRTQLKPAFAQAVRGFLNRYKLADYDLEIGTAEYVALDLVVDVCVCPEHFRADVAQAVRNAMSNRTNADGTLGFFHPDRFTFGDDVFLSRIYSAVEDITGVDSCAVTRFQRFGKTANGELESGVLPIGPWEIARLDNDPNFLERGALRINALGGK